MLLILMKDALDEDGCVRELSRYGWTGLDLRLIIKPPPS